MIILCLVPATFPGPAGCSPVLGSLAHFFFVLFKHAQRPICYYVCTLTLVRYTPRLDMPTPPRSCSALPCPALPSSALPCRTQTYRLRICSPCLRRFPGVPAAAQAPADVRFHYGDHPTSETPFRESGWSSSWVKNAMELQKLRAHTRSTYDHLAGPPPSTTCCPPTSTLVFSPRQVNISSLPTNHTRPHLLCRTVK